MKKISYYLLFTLLAVFLTISTAQALPLLEYGNADPYVGTFAANNYDYEDINAAIADWNGEYDPDLMLLPDNNYDYIPAPGGNWPDDYEPIELTWEGTYDYLTVKYDGVVDLFYLAGLEAVDGVYTFTWYNTYQESPLNALSHARLWNPAPVPEPATMLLLGSGLVGLAVAGRKKFKK